MPRLEDDSTDIRQQLEFCLTKKETDDQQPVLAKSSSVPLGKWNSFAAGAGLSAILILGVPIIYCAGSMFGMPQLPSRNVAPTVAPSSVMPIPITIVNPVDVPDPGNASDAVAVTPMTRQQMLSAAKSAITGIVDPQTMTASYYWTMVLHNGARAGQEAQMELKLPAGSVVSRATLWIHGRPQEAAFNEKNNVEHAYGWLVNRRQDPLLITQVAPDRVLIKASPVQHGSDMKLRVGMTVPMHLNEHGEACLTMPQVLVSNFALDCRQDVHLTSPVPLNANQVDMRSSEGKEFVLRGNIKANELRDLRVTAPGQSKVVQVATRATHSNPPAYIVATVNTEPGSDYGRVHYTKTFSEPNCQIISSDDAAYRVSYLWAHQEIEKLAQTDDQQAVELASIYREVSSVSGAVVLELQSDYTFNGLDRNMYRTTAYTESARLAAPPKAMMPAGILRRANKKEFADLSVDKAAFAQSDAMMMPQASPVAVHAAASPGPSLQGASNGTVSPQGADAMIGSLRTVVNATGPQAPDAGLVNGVNTAEKTRVNNWRNIESVFNLSTILGAATAIIFGVVLMIASLIGKADKQAKTIKRVRKMLFGASLLALGLSLPWMVNSIVAFIRDSNVLG
jgi:hypothetical protein